MKNKMDKRESSLWGSRREMTPRPPTQNLDPQRGFSEVCSRPQDKEVQTSLGDKGIDTGLRRHLMDTMDRQLIQALFCLGTTESKMHPFWRPGMCPGCPDPSCQQ